MPTYTGVVLGLVAGPGGVRCAVSRRRWIRLPAFSDRPDWLFGCRVRIRTEADHAGTAASLEVLPWPDEAALARYTRSPSAWGAAETWLWTKGWRLWQLLAAARAHRLLILLRRLPPREVLACLCNPFAWASTSRHAIVKDAPFGLWDAAARRLRPERAWPPAWRDARLLAAWRSALWTAIARRGLQPIAQAELVHPVRRLLRCDPGAPVVEPAQWDSMGIRRDTDGRLWPRELDQRRAVVFQRVAANQRAWSFALPTAQEDHIAATAFGWTYSAITGPAGSGKTTAVLRLVADARSAGLRVAVAALTGRAAAVLGDGAQTVHRLLRYGPWGWGIRRLDADLVVVDEASMLNWDAAAAILEAAAGRVVFVGDERQLPPVSGEQVFSELLARVPVARLDRVRRVAPEQRTRVMCCDDSEAMVRSAVSTIARWARSSQSWQLITPYRIGPTGCDRLNRLLQEVVNSCGAPIAGTAWRIGDRVVLRRPHPPCGAPNGLIGQIVRSESGGIVLRARSVDIGPIPVDAVELAYAITIHRAQGSEWDQVLVLCPLTADRGFIDPRMRYVALTRSRRETLCMLA